MEYPYTPIVGDADQTTWNICVERNPKLVIIGRAFARPIKMAVLVPAAYAECQQKHADVICNRVIFYARLARDPLACMHVVGTNLFKRYISIY